DPRPASHTMHAVGDPGEDRRIGPITIGLLAVRVAVLLVTMQIGGHRPLTDDLARFREISTMPGTPYRTFPVEYMPGEVLFIGAVVWIAYAGVSETAEVLTFRHATGWGVESTVGTITWIATGGPIRLESGAPRIGSAPTWATASLTLTLAVLLVGIWTTAAKR